MPRWWTILWDDDRDKVGVAAGARQCVEVMCAVDGHTHQIDDMAMTDPDMSGRIVALCGRGVMAAALVTPPGPLCPLCCAAVNTGRAA